MRKEFDMMKDAILQACQKKDYVMFEEAAKGLGFDKSDESRSFILSYVYKLSNEQGHCVIVNFKSYDPSGAFRNIPDVNEFKMTLVKDGYEIDAYVNAYHG